LVPSSDQKHENVTFVRDCDAIIIPDGFPIVVPEETIGIVMQVLGGNYTIRLDSGYLVRIDGPDSDAIGKERTLPESAELADGELDAESVMSALRSCFDPEIPVNIVDLGLVYDCDVCEIEEGGHRVDVTMTLTAPGCGMGQVLKDDVERRVSSLPGVTEARIDLVFDPPWSVDRMSEAARLELGFE